MFDKYVLKHKTHLDLFTKVKSLFKIMILIIQDEFHIYTSITVNLTKKDTPVLPRKMKSVIFAEA